MRPRVPFPILMIAMAWLSLTPAHAESPLPSPKGTVILTISGAIEHTNGQGVARFDRAMLDALPGRKADVETPWLKERAVFEGPLTSGILDAVGAHGSRLRIEALNDYVAYIPIDEARSLDIILANRLNGEPLSVRDRGPLFVIYPFDQDPSLYNEAVFSRSVWQIRAIVVE